MMPSGAPRPLADDDGRAATHANPDVPEPQHIAVAGDTYTFLIAGEQTNGRYALIDTLIPPGGGPPPHRHYFEEMFHVLEGDIEATVRGTTLHARAGETVNIPGLAPHAFKNAGATPARLLCVVAPAGLERFFAQIGDPVSTRTSPPPQLTKDERRARLEKAMALAPEYGIEVFAP